MYGLLCGFWISFVIIHFLNLSGLLLVFTGKDQKPTKQSTRIRGDSLAFSEGGMTDALAEHSRQKAPAITETDFGEA